MSRMTGIAFLIAAALSQPFDMARAADGVYGVEELNRRKDAWSEWVDQPVKVEGRVSAVSKFQFRFIHCDLTFRVTEDQSRTVGNVRNVEVSGRMKKEKETGKLYFAVDRVKVLGSDVEQLEAREAKLKSTKAADWYDLAGWAEARGKFYQDDELQMKSRRIWMKGLQTERTNLAANDAEARLALAGKLRERDVDQSLQAELIHEAARIRWIDAQKGKSLNEYAAWLKKTYPACSEPLAEFPRGLSQKYEANPLETYRTADEDDRGRIARLLFLQVELGRILADLKSDGSNAATIADALATRVPERSDLVAKYREQAFGWRLKSITTAPRDEALRLAEDLKSRDQADDAKELLRGWVRAQEAKAKKDDPVGLMQLAEDYLQLVQDEPAAVKLLAEAHKLDSSFEDAGDRLKQLGYHFEQNRWIKGDAPNAPATPEKVPSQLAAGMTADAVLLLLGEPNGKTRVFTGKGLQEVWSYGRRGTPRLLIHLQQPIAGQPPKVTRFFSEN